MKSGLYKIAILLSLANLISCILGGITIYTSVLRSVIVFLGTLLVFTIFLNVLRWGLTSNLFIQKKQSDSEQVENE